jgi:Rad3-related DNA helicase
VSINILTKGPKVTNPMAPSGLGGESIFNFSYQNRDNEGVLVDLGRSVCKIAETTPGGMLIFFPSYRVMEKCHEVWEGSRVNKDIETKAKKRVFLEPKDPAKYQITMEKYYKAIFNQQQDKKKG